MSNGNFSGTKILITGGTGSFGQTMARKLLNTDVAELRIYSRDEEKQDRMRHGFKDSRIRFYLGDVRDPSSVQSVVSGVDYVFHAAALKQVPSCEFFPLEGVRTNILGSSTVIEASHRAGVRKVVCLSTDKAVRPVNAMGMSKALMEKTAQAFARNHPESPTSVCVTRYGNVMYSRGSVIPLFVSQIKAGEALTVTNPKMTRFMMTLEDSVALVEYAFAEALPGDLLVKKAPGATIETLVAALGELFCRRLDVETIGIRHGEKMHETLATSEELSRSVDNGDYFDVRLDARGLDYRPFFDAGEPEVDILDDYSSDSAEQLDVDQMMQLLLQLPALRQELGD